MVQQAGELDSVNPKSESGQRTFERLTFYCFPVFCFFFFFSYFFLLSVEGCGKYLLVNSSVFVDKLCKLWTPILRNRSGSHAMFWRIGTFNIWYDVRQLCADSSVYFVFRSNWIFLYIYTKWTLYLSMFLVTICSVGILFLLWNYGPSAFYQFCEWRKQSCEKWSDLWKTRERSEEQRDLQTQTPMWILPWKFYLRKNWRFSHDC